MFIVRTILPPPDFSMRRIDGKPYAVATNFSAFMHPDFDWHEPQEFGDAFDELIREDQTMAAHTNTDPSYPGFVNIGFDKEPGKVVIIVRGDPSVPVIGDDDSTGPGDTVMLTLDISAWDLLIAQAIRERAAVSGA